MSLFHTVEVVTRASETQLQVCEKYFSVSSALMIEVHFQLLV